MENLLKIELKSKNFIFLGALIAIVSSFTLVELALPVLIVFFGLTLGLLLISVLDISEKRFLIKVFIAAFLTRIFFAVFISNTVSIFTGYPELGDGWCYTHNGKVILDLWLGGERDLAKISQEAFRRSASGTLGAYDFWSAIVFLFTGYNPLSPILVNCLLSSLTAIFIYGLAEKIYDKRAAKIACVLTAFWPSIFFWSVQNLKEPISLFLIAVLIWSLVHLKLQVRIHLLFLIVIFGLSLRSLRAFLFGIFLITLPISIIFGYLKDSKYRLLLILLMICLILIFYSADLVKVIQQKVIVNLLRLGDEQYASENTSVLGWIYKMRSDKALGADSAFLNVIISGKPWMYFLVAGPLLMAISFLAPFPWMLGSALQIIGAPEMILFYFLIPSIFRGGRLILRHKIREGGGIVLTYVALMYLAFTFTEGNIGTLFRHRSMVLPFVFILSGIGLSQKYEYTNTKNRTR